jgi:hypothetical protein
MFSLIKTLVMLVVLFVVVVLGLGFFAPTPEKQAALGGQLAGIAVKGCRGSRVLFDSLLKKVKEQIAEEEAAKERAKLAQAEEAAE